MTSNQSLPLNSRILIRTIRLGSVSLAGWFFFYSAWESAEIRFLGACMVITAIWPLAGWVRRNDDSYPLAETMLMMTVPFYVVPLFNDHRALANYPSEVIFKSGICVLVFQLALLLGMRLVSNRPRRTRALWTEALIPDNRLHYVAIGLLVNSIWLWVSNFTTIVPGTLVGTFRAIFIGIGLISAFTSARLWGLSLLGKSLRFWLILNVFFQVTLLSSSLLLIQGITLIGATFLGYFSASRRIPWFIAALALVAFTFLHNGKSKMRTIYWEEGRPAPTFTQLPEFYTEWFEIGYSAFSENEEEGALLLFDRASLLQIVAYIVDQVPRNIDYFSGETYRGIPAQVVPRFMWPDKPSPNESVKTLSIGLGMLSAVEAESTSIGFGMISEAYANFGFWGSGLLGISFGFFMQSMALRTMNSSTFSLNGLLRILLLAWCLNAEVTLVIWLSSMYQACIAISVPAIMWSKLNGGGTSNAPPAPAMESHSE